MNGSLKRFLRVEFAPPQYLSLPTAGIDISTSGIKIAIIRERKHGLELAQYAEERLPLGAVTGGEIADRAVTLAALEAIAKSQKVRIGNVALSESRSYLFEAEAAGTTPEQRRTSVEQHIDEYIPLPPSDIAFDIVPVAPPSSEGNTPVIGVGYARRVIDESLSLLDESGILVRSIESETFSIARALMAYGDTETVLVIDIGRTTTKLMVVTGQVPRFATTLDIGGHALTLAVQKHFGVTEEEAKKVKAERGLIAGAENDEYLAAMLSTVSAIREEIVRRLEYWQSRAQKGTAHEPVTRAILVGGNATVRGLPEYLETALKMPVALGDVFTNLARKDDWLPPMDYMESLAYATAIGLALREYVPA